MNKKRNKMPIIWAIVVLMLMLNGNVGATASLTSSTPGDEYLIVALGDSISAGYEPGMDEKSVPYGFVERLSEQGLFHGRTKSVNYGILGLTSTGLGNYVSAIKDGKQVTPNEIQQGLPDPRIAAFAAGTSTAKADLSNADLITITIGGNDIQKLLPDIKDMSSDQLTAQSTDILTNYALQVRNVVDTLIELNPEAQIVVADQYQPFPKIAGAGTYVTLQNVAASFTAAVDEIAEQYTAQGKNVKAAHVAEAFVGREISLTHIYPETDIHPNQKGYEEIAKVISKVVWDSYTETAAKKGEAEISIVVKGVELKTQYQPVLKNGQTFIAIKDITDAIGGESRWNSKTQSATVTYEGRSVVIPMGSNKITSNGETLTTASPAFLHKIGKESKTYVPLAILAQGLGLDVKYSGKTKTVFINL
ncbi:lysophospholipase L1-like esterase [Fontibacillus solani]|uniref:Lysophospholipase L1-like esterase n=1 Tax=Fontibacillus solani TaxID=1572857 RepID=A0A7W3SWG5_9BACL|nr:stalk domain-containing protein [Fontibacillus solani]MBA9087521.1 lysophospholipase L1-like esterase [Fontibacillus solani]